MPVTLQNGASHDQGESIHILSLLAPSLPQQLTLVVFLLSYSYMIFNQSACIFSLVCFLIQFGDLHMHHYNC